MAKCRKCGAGIIFISLSSGNAMPCDIEIVEGLKDPEGEDILISEKGEVVRCSLKPSPMLSVPVYGRRPHSATCLDENGFN